MQRAKDDGEGRGHEVGPCGSRAPQGSKGSWGLWLVLALITGGTNVGKETTTMEGGPEGRQTTSSVLCSCSFFFSSEHFFACLFKFKKNVVYIFCRIKNRCLILHPFVYDEESAIQSIFPTHDVCTDKRITPSIDPSHIKEKH